MKSKAKHKWPARTAAAALGLLLAAWAPASMADTPCQKLESKGEAGRKPSAVTVTEAKNGNAMLVWDFPSGSPQDAFEGWCVEKRHVDTNKKREECYGQIGINVAMFNSCVGHQDCPTGKFKFRVMLENTCGFTEPWSDSVDFEF